MVENIKNSIIDGKRISKATNVRKIHPYLRILKSQLEKYIGEELGETYLLKVKNQEQLHKIKKEISDLKKKLKALEWRTADLEESLKK